MSFRQIILVLKREYMTRIRSKAFILATILIPVGFIAFVGIGVGIALFDSKTQRTIGIVDQTKALYPRLEKIDSKQYTNYSDLTVDSVRSMVQHEQIDGYLVLNNANIDSNKSLEFISAGTGGLKIQSSVRSDIRSVIRDERLNRANVSQNIKDIYERSIGFKTHKLTESGKETDDDTGFLTILGMAMGIIIMASISGYGGLIARSVIEEKTNRIIEVIASSVKPIELLCGKLAGIGSLALTQITIWVGCILGISAASGPVIALFAGSQMEQVPAATQTSPMVGATGFSLPPIQTSVIVYFIIFFLLGYLLYSSLFAALGSAADSKTDTQQFMIPIMVPIMIAYFIMFQTINNPDGMLSVVGSLVPFCTPIVMISRIAITDVPIWQIGLSIILMIGTIAGTLWLSSKIYRVGILKFGDSASFKELMKWIRE